MSKSFLTSFVGLVLVCVLAFSVTADSRSSRAKKIAAFENVLKQDAENNAARVRGIAEQLKNVRAGDSIQLKSRVELTVVENSDGHPIVSGSDGVCFEICGDLADFAEEVNYVTKAKSTVDGK